MPDEVLARTHKATCARTFVAAWLLRESKVGKSERAPSGGTSSCDGGRGDEPAGECVAAWTRHPEVLPEERRDGGRARPGAVHVKFGNVRPTGRVRLSRPSTQGSVGTRARITTPQAGGRVVGDAGRPGVPVALSARAPAALHDGSRLESERACACVPACVPCVRVRACARGCGLRVRSGCFLIPPTQGRPCGGRAASWCAPGRFPASPRTSGTTRTAASTGRRISPDSQVGGGAGGLRGPPPGLSLGLTPDAPPLPLPPAKPQ